MPPCPDLYIGSLITSNLTHHSRLLFNCECVFISVSGRAAISCCTFALQCGHAGVSQQCVGRHRDITHIPTCRGCSWKFHCEQLDLRCGSGCHRAFPGSFSARVGERRKTHVGGKKKKKG